MAFEPRTRRIRWFIVGPKKHLHLVDHAHGNTSAWGYYAPSGSHARSLCGYDGKIMRIEHAVVEAKHTCTNCARKLRTEMQKAPQTSNSIDALYHMVKFTGELFTKGR